MKFTFEICVGTLVSPCRYEIHACLMEKPLCVLSGLIFDWFENGTSR